MIVAEVQEISRHVNAIVEAAREQSTGLQEINTAVNIMDQGTQQNAAMVEQSTAASHSLAREAASLTALLAHFCLDRDDRPICGPQANRQKALSPRLADLGKRSRMHSVRVLAGWLAHNSTSIGLAIRRDFDVEPERDVGKGLSGEWQNRNRRAERGEVFNFCRCGTPHQMPGGGTVQGR